MGPIGSPETSVWNYRYSLPNSSEERSSNIRYTLFLTLTAKRKSCRHFTRNPTEMERVASTKTKNAPYFMLTEKVNRNISVLFGNHSARWQCMVYFTLRPLYPPKNSKSVLNLIFGGSQGRSVLIGKGKFTGSVCINWKRKIHRVGLY